MSPDSHDLVARIHRQGVEQMREEEAQGHALVEAMFREALARQQEQEKRQRALVESVHREAQRDGAAPEEAEPPTAHYTELPAPNPGSPLYHEWNAYRREVGRLLAEGNAGRYLLMKGEQILGIWETADEAFAAGYKRFPGQPFLVHQIQERERILRCTSTYRCRN